MYKKLSEANIQGKKVLLRAGFDVPITDGQVTDLTRPKAMVPTMKYILDGGASLIIMAHQGRPKGERVPEMSQKPLVSVLQELLGVEVKFVEDCRGDDVAHAADALQPREVLLLENLRFDPAEKSKDQSERDVLGKSLADLADMYVNDAFTNCHRDHASMTSIPKFLPSYMGLQLEKEVEYLGSALDNPKGPVTLIVAGSKMETKVPVIENFLDKGDNIAVGGCIANTLIAAQGFSVAESRYEKERIPQAQDIMMQGEQEGNATVHVPTDVIVASDFDSTEVLDIPVEDIMGDMKIFDVGRRSAEAYCDIIRSSGTIVWNGPLGVYEKGQFASASKLIATAIIEATDNGAISIIGGGDTIDFFERYNMDIEKCSFASTGGGAMLEMISGKTLPALAALDS